MVRTKSSFGTPHNICNDMLCHEIVLTGWANEELNGSTWSLLLEVVCIII